jgi:hypothetical protein
MKTIGEYRKCTGNLPDGTMCGANSWLMNEIVKEQVNLGNIGKDAVGCVEMPVYTNFDARKPPIAGGRVKSARVMYDICKKCGHKQVVRIEEGYVTIPTMQGQQAIFS